MVGCGAGPGYRARQLFVHLGEVLAWQFEEGRGCGGCLVLRARAGSVCAFRSRGRQGLDWDRDCPSGLFTRLSRPALRRWV